MSTPVRPHAYPVSPEQSKALVPVAPHRYREPICDSARRAASRPEDQLLRPDATSDSEESEAEAVSGATDDVAEIVAALCATGAA